MSAGVDPAEARVREALAEGRAPEPEDVRVLLHALDRARAESEARWRAIGSLAPAAKHHRGRAEEQARVLAALALHLGRLEAMLAACAPEEPLRAWLEEARRLVGQAAGQPGGQPGAG